MLVAHSSATDKPAGVCLNSESLPEYPLLPAPEWPSPLPPVLTSEESQERLTQSYTKIIYEDVSRERIVESLGDVQMLEQSMNKTVASEGKEICTNWRLMLTKNW